MINLKQLLSGRAPKEKQEARDREITTLRHELKNSIQAVQSGNRILNSMSGMIELNRRGKAR